METEMARVQCENLRAIDNQWVKGEGHHFSNFDKFRKWLQILNEYVKLTKQIVKIKTEKLPFKTIVSPWSNPLLHFIEVDTVVIL